MELSNRYSGKMTISKLPENDKLPNPEDLPVDVYDSIYLTPTKVTEYIINSKEE